jgi:adenylate kinase family enzyme
VRRIAVIGNGAGGKTTFARALASALDIPHHEVDTVQFRDDWSRAPAGDTQRTLDAWAAEDAWVIDGFGPWPCIERRLAAADTIVWIDYPLPRHLWRAARRQLLWRGSQRRPSSRLMLKMILHVHTRYRPSLETGVRPHLDKVVHLRSPRDARRWLENACSER